MKATNEHDKTSLNSVRTGGGIRPSIAGYATRSTSLPAPLDNLYGVKNFLFSNCNQLSGFGGATENINARLFELFIQDAAAPAELTVPTSKTKADTIQQETTSATCNLVPAQMMVAEAVQDTLWTVKEAALFLRKSRRWLFDALRLEENVPGSVPHVRLGRSPRFIPDDLKLWASMNFPPAATFKAWRDADRRKKKVG
jgi:hypothetical protein